MTITKYKDIFLWLLFVATVVILLSVLADVPYIISILGLSAWAFFGHLITLDDDMPGEWSNPDGSKKIWNFSKLELLIKFLVFIGLFALIGLYPSIKQYGA